MVGDGPRLPSASWEGATVESFIITDISKRPLRRPWRCWLRRHQWEIRWWVGVFREPVMENDEVLNIGECCPRCGKVRERRA